MVDNPEISVLKISQVECPEHSFTYNPAEINRLVESIKKVGVAQPITVHPDRFLANRYIVTEGIRRFQAARLAGVSKIYAIIDRNYSEDVVATKVPDSREVINKSAEAEAIGLTNKLLNDPSRMKILSRGLWNIVQRFNKSMRKSTPWKYPVLGLPNNKSLLIKSRGMLPTLDKAIYRIERPKRKDKDKDPEHFYLVHPETGKRYMVKHGIHIADDPAQIADEKRKAKSTSTGSHIAFNKSWSTEMSKKNPGARWVTITDSSSPLHGRHILIMPHTNGTATILWAPNKSGLTHKTLEPRKSKEGDSKSKALIKKKAKIPEISEEKETELLEEKKGLQEHKAEERGKLHAIIKKKLGRETEVTSKEKQKIEKKIQKIADPVKQKAERMLLIRKAVNEKQQAMNDIIKDAKKAMLGDLKESDDAPSEIKQLNAVVRENAEELLKHWYSMKAYQRQSSVITKMLKTGNVKSGTDTVEMKPMSLDEIKQTVADEKALKEAIESHYKLIIQTRGGMDENGREIKPKGAGNKTILHNIDTGGFEALIGITGEAAGTQILSREKYDLLGARNASVLADYYLRNTITDYGNKISSLNKYIENKGAEIAAKGVRIGDDFVKKAQRVREMGRGEDRLYADAIQAVGSSLTYLQRGYESYGQAEGALHLVAELLYHQDAPKKTMKLSSGSRATLKRRVSQLGLNKGDVVIKKLDDGYEMRIKEKAFEKLISEKPIVEFKKTIGEVTSADIKAGRANTDNYHPAGINTYLPPDADGSSERLFIAPHQQSSARLLYKEKKIFLNHEAGTGKSLTYLNAKAFLEEQTGRQIKTIISMPMKTMSNFKDEVEKFTDYKVVIVNDAMSAKRAKKYQSDSNTIVVVNKEKFLHDKVAIQDAKFDMVIADEAHKITQREGRDESGMSQGLAETAKMAEYFIAGTGTPTTNDLSELFFFLKVMNPDKYTNQKSFMEKYGTLHRGAGLKDKLSEIMNKEIDDKVFTHKKNLQHTFKQKTHTVELTKNQKQRYREINEKYAAKMINPFNRDAQMSDLLNSSSHKDNPKFDKIKELIDDHIKTKGKDEKIILYAKNYSTVKEIRKFFKEHYSEYDHVEFTGKTKAKELAPNKQRFITDKKVKFAIHTGAGTEGLNLQYTGKKGTGGATTAIAIASGEHSYSTIDQFFSRANRTGVPESKEINGHLILTDTPHDINTEIRLHDKKNIMGLIDNATALDELNLLHPSANRDEPKPPKIRKAFINTRARMVA